MKSVLTASFLFIVSLSVFAEPEKSTSADKSVGSDPICGTTESEDYFQFIVSRVNGHRYRIMENLDTDESTLILENGNRICVRFKIISSEPMYPDDPAYAARERAQGHQTNYIKIKVYDIWPDRSSSN